MEKEELDEAAKQERERVLQRLDEMQNEIAEIKAELRARQYSEKVPA
jgi:hypothetical protein